ncbi:MAG TPA: cysteine desulfurase [Clostridiaceae bacterium]|jgi:cysteine desulfurase|nr:cysteine desulfurase [Clostridiaceae bacterium]
MNEEYIYLDYASNTPVDKDVLNTFNEITLKYFANPNSTHILGKVTNKKIQETTENIIKELSKKANLDENMEIIYTSGSSESNNLAIKGIAKSYKENGKHIISTFLEHSSVSSPLTYLKEQGYEIDIVNITNEGKVDLEHLKSLIRKDTILVSICYVDSEVGIVQPIEEIAKIVKEYPNCFFHVDCTQAVGKINIDLKNIDLISFAPHKFYGLNGFGALIKNKEIVLEPLINGGASTTIYRSGTPVIGQICALEKALEISFNNLEERKKYVKNINKKLRENLSKYKDVKINTISDENPFILNISVNGVKATEFKNKLEEYGVCISIKSACTITITPSRIVMAMTHDRKRALDSFRISLSHLVKESEINKFLEIFDKCYKYFKEV